MADTQTERPTISAVPDDVETSKDSDDRRTKENEAAGLTVENQIVITFLLPDDSPVDNMFSENNTEPPSSNGGGLDFEKLEQFGHPVRMDSLREDFQASDFVLSSVKFVPEKNKVSLTFFRDGNLVNLSESEKTALNLLMDIPFHEGLLSEAKSDGAQQFASILLKDWVLNTQEHPIEHFRLRGSRLSLCSK